MIWNNKELKTYSDIGDAVVEILDAPDAEEQASKFMKLYSQETIYAFTNVGYIAGYYDPDTMQRIFKVFKTSHPIFGTTTPSHEELFSMGQKWGAQERLNK